MDDKVSFRRNPDYIYREIAGEAVLVPTGKVAESFFGIISINSTGAFLWKALEQERSLEELIEMFAQEYDLEKKQSLQDVAEFLDTALSRNMVLRC
ncbi:PqqD family protein [Bariatricus sp. HCP3S3_E12]|uniref:PqqD family protein n=1 Tax=Lachnospiraceae TaxID=186803 RepID=UPI003D05276D